MFLFLLAGTHRSCKHSCLSPFVSITNENTVQRHARGLMVPRHTALIMKYCSCVYTHKDTYKPSEVFSKKLSELTRMFTPGSAGSLLLLSALLVFFFRANINYLCLLDCLACTCLCCWHLHWVLCWCLCSRSLHNTNADESKCFTTFFQMNCFFTVFRGNKNAQATSQ